MRRVRMVDLAARHREVADDVEARVLSVLRSGRYIGGPVVAEVEQQAAAWFHRTSAVGTASGTDALMLAMQAVGVRRGDEVIVPALSFFATAGAVQAIGATPVVVDVREDALLDPVAAEAAWTPQTRALVPVHLFGSLAEVGTVDVPIVDDAAQAIGGEPPRAIGDLTVLSTYPTKTWGGAGDGGFVIGDQPDLIERVRLLGNHGIKGIAHHHSSIDGFTGRNSRVDALQAAVLLGHAAVLAERIARRREIASRYDRQLPDWVRPLPRDSGSPIHHYVVRVPQRDAVRTALQEHGVDTAVYYPKPLGRQPAISRPVHTPVADALCESMVALPVHAGLADEDVQWVLQVLEEVGRPASRRAS